MENSNECFNNDKIVIGWKLTAETTFERYDQIVTGQYFHCKGRKWLIVDVNCRNV